MDNPNFLLSDTLLSILEDSINDKNVCKDTRNNCSVLPGSEMLSPVAKHLALKCHQNTYKMETEWLHLNAKWELFFVHYCMKTQK